MIFLCLQVNHSYGLCEFLCGKYLFACVRWIYQINDPLGLRITKSYLFVFRLSQFHWVNCQKNKYPSKTKQYKKISADFSTKAIKLQRKTPLNLHRIQVEQRLYQWRSYFSYWTFLVFPAQISPCSDSHISLHEIFL